MQLVSLALVAFSFAPVSGGIQDAPLDVRNALKKLARADRVAFEALLGAAPDSYGEVARASARAWEQGEVSHAARIDAVRLALVEQHAELLEAVLLEAKLGEAGGGAAPANALAPLLLAALPESARMQLFERWASLDEGQRSAALPAIVSLPGEAIERHVIELVDVGATELRVVAARALGRSKWAATRPDALEALARAATDSDEALAFTACVALEDLAAGAGTGRTAILTRAVDAWCSALDHARPLPRVAASVLLAAHPEDARRPFEARLQHGATTDLLLRTGAHVAPGHEHLARRTREAVDASDMFLVVTALDTLVAAGVPAAERSSIYTALLEHGHSMVRDAAPLAVLLDHEVVAELVRPVLARLLRSGKYGRDSDAPLHLVLAYRKVAVDEATFVKDALEAIGGRGDMDSVVSAVVVVLPEVSATYAPVVAKALAGGGPTRLAFALVGFGEVGEVELLRVLEGVGAPGLAALGAADAGNPAVRARILGALANPLERKAVLRGLDSFPGALPGAFDALLSSAKKLPDDEVALLLRVAAVRDPESKALGKVAAQLAQSSKNDAVRLAATVALGKTGANDKVLRTVLEVELRDDPGSDVCRAVLLTGLFTRPAKANTSVLLKALDSTHFDSRLLAMDAARKAPELDAEVIDTLIAGVGREARMERLMAIRSASEARGPRAGVAAALGRVAATSPLEHAELALTALDALPAEERRDAAPYLRAIERGAFAHVERVVWRRARVEVAGSSGEERDTLPGRPEPAMEELHRARALVQRARSLLVE